MAVLLGKCYLCVCPTAIGPVQLPCCNGLITGDTPWAFWDDTYHLTGSYHMGGDKIRWRCSLVSTIRVSTQLPAIGPVQLPCCNSLITGDTPWALGDGTYHLTGS
jgi:hypothetical protein